MHLMIYFQLNDLEIGKGYNLNSEKVGMVSSFDPHNMCAKVEKITTKMDALRVQTGPSLSKYEGFTRKLICYKDISIFETYFNSRLYLHSICTIQSHILKFQPFLLHLIFFMHLMIYFELNDLEIGKHYS